MGEGDMAIGIYFVHDGFTPEKYDATLKKLEEAGAESPKGRRIHYGLESNDAIHVFDVWESHEEFEEFGKTLVPILAGLGVELKEPMVANVYNVIKG
jgi:hypothetical protein